jgi:hypothetical protein
MILIVHQLIRNSILRLTSSKVHTKDNSPIRLLRVEQRWSKLKNPDKTRYLNLLILQGVIQKFKGNMYQTINKVTINKTSISQNPCLPGKQILVAVYKVVELLDCMVVKTQIIHFCQILVMEMIIIRATPKNNTTKYYSKNQDKLIFEEYMPEEQKNRQKLEKIRYYLLAIKQVFSMIILIQIQKLFMRINMMLMITHLYQS